MNDFEEFNVTPELTLDPFQEEKKETPQIYQETEPETPELHPFSLQKISHRIITVDLHMQFFML